MADYYDILLLGRTGMGKSTLGNKLLHPRTPKNIKQWTSEFPGLLQEKDEHPGQFFAATGSSSVTKRSKLLSNEDTKIRVLDVQGFADSEESGDVDGSNKGIINQISKILEKDMSPCKVIYFLPWRGTPERIDGHFMQELEVMQDFFSHVIFQTMIIVATRKTKSADRLGPLDEEDMQKNTECAYEAISRITKCVGQDRINPPVIYIGEKDEQSDVIKKIRGTRVRNERGLKRIPRKQASQVVFICTAERPYLSREEHFFTYTLQGVVIMASITSKSEYYDILLLGKTGMGKSTLGNKLIYSGNSECIRPWSSGFPGLLQNDAYDEHCGNFYASSSMTSITRRCKLLSNEETKVRVLDTQGFADSSAYYEPGLYRSNMEILRQILAVQIEKKLLFRRVVYFLPWRETMDRIDGNLMEELKVLHHFFTDAIFHTMIIVATRKTKNACLLGPLDKEDMEKNREGVYKAIHQITKCESIRPPVIYIGENDDPSAVLSNIRETTVENERGIEPELNRYRCLKCSMEIHYAVSLAGEPTTAVCINKANGEMMPYDKTLCHPVIIPKHSKFVRAMGGLAHIATLRIASAFTITNETELWPGFTNTDEKCANCEHPPGTRGCMQVHSDHEGIKVKHSSGIENMREVLR